MHKPLVAIDSNIIVSSIIDEGGLQGRMLDVWREGLIRIVISKEILEEVTEVLNKAHIRKNYILPNDRLSAILNNFEFSSDEVIIFEDVNLPLHSRDIKDDKILAVALVSGAEYLVTGDKDLLSLSGRKELGKLKIVTTRKFLEIIDKMNKFE